MPIQLVLFGPGTVHSLDDAEHHHRLVEQRGGVATGHRCPGEAVTLTMLAVAARVLARRPARFLPRTWATISPVSPPARTAA